MWLTICEPEEDTTFSLPLQCWCANRIKSNKQFACLFLRKGKQNRLSMYTRNRSVEENYAIFTVIFLTITTLQKTLTEVKTTKLLDGVKAKSYGCKRERL
ncbi:hypothetical protein KIL84_019024 [Mauremys mutica]|uniref:Uncharacterized protein n=1 Tax=Mauremys mutica TaxID=74926 RepID=A0A9D3XVZ7_9SAUR|nr:hypothetical protein KIL84_019024 [Mauremys mutica]